MSILECEAIASFVSPLKLDKALSIEGWMFPLELLWLAHQSASHNRIVELGCYLGRSTRVLADNTPGIVIAVDDFYGPRDAKVKDRESVFYRFKENLEDVLGKVMICREDFDSISPELLNPPFDMIFIDGSHEYKDVRRDIDKWLPHLSPGGLICGHDFNEGCRGVQQAVLETFTYQTQIVPNSGIWYVE